MADILDRRTPLHVVQAEEGMALKLSTVYMAPPDHHMLVEKNRIHLTTTELVHFVRPSADLLLESVAAAYGPVCVGVVLTGSGKDGALGIRAIKVKGGLTIAQDPVSAESRSMPAAAIATGAVDKVLPLEDIADAIIQATALEERNA